MTKHLPTRPRFQRLLHDSLVRSVHDFPQKPALITDKEVVTYEELFDEVQRCAAALMGRGLKRGDRVIIYADNTFECVVALWATLWAGGVFVIVNPQTKSDKLAYIVEKSQAAILVTDQHL